MPPTPLALLPFLARSLNPSPYMFYFNFRLCHRRLAGNPCSARGDTVTVRPIAGTRRRGVSFEEDQALERICCPTRRERAERVRCLTLPGATTPGALSGVGKLTENMMVERYSHVMHIVSNVEGKLQDGLNALDVLKATFPKPAPFLARPKIACDGNHR